MGRILEEDNEIPVVINTAYSSYKDSFLSWSADAYITKSSDLTELKATIHDILSKGEGSPQAEGKEPANEAPAAEHAAQ
jgi:DNA-binding response OmpR family regulator